MHRSDFLPFRNGPREFWSGYFTSRPTFKKHCKITAQYLHSVRNMVGAIYLNEKHILAKVNVSDSLAVPMLFREKTKVMAAMEKLEQTVSLMQHHDAITGTAYQAVFDEYQGIMSKAV